jgi:hypothetical protein
MLQTVRKTGNWIVERGVLIQLDPGELGLGPDEPKSATKPTRNVPLTGLDVIDIAAGQNTTLFLVKPNEKFADMPRHPVELEAPETCVGCERDYGDPLTCDKVCFDSIVY